MSKASSLKSLVKEATTLNEAAMKDIVMTIARARQSGIDLFDKESLIEHLKANKEFRTIHLLNKDYNKVIDTFIDLY